MLIILGGLPGSGKTALARAVARTLRAVHLRVDTIEQALRTCGTLPDGVVTEGYVVAYAMAADQLRLGLTVIADTVNPLPITRDAWLAVAGQAGVRGVEVEVVCSDPAEYQRRVDRRVSDIPGLVLPRWADVQRRDYAPWQRPRIVIDTAGRTVDASAAELLAALA